jgi:hypothetical protein
MASFPSEPPRSVGAQAALPSAARRTLPSGSQRVPALRNIFPTMRNAFLPLRNMSKPCVTRSRVCSTRPLHCATRSSHYATRSSACATHSKHCATRPKPARSAHRRLPCLQPQGRCKSLGDGGIHALNDHGATMVDWLRAPFNGVKSRSPRVESAFLPSGSIHRRATRHVAVGPLHRCGCISACSFPSDCPAMPTGKRLSFDSSQLLLTILMLPLIFASFLNANRRTIL